MSVETPTPPATPPSADRIKDEARKKLDEAKGRIGLMQKIKEMMDNFKEGKGKEAFKNLTAIIVAVFTGKLHTLKEDVEKTRKEKENKKEGGNKAKEKKPDKKKSPKKKEDDKKEKKDDKPEKTAPAPNVKSTAKPLDESKLSETGKKVLPALASQYPDIEIQPGIVNLETAISQPRKGAKNWPRKSTQDWDYEKAGNTEDLMKDGKYRIEATIAPNGYTRNDTNKPPAATRQKLAKIAMSLLNNKKMPLFTGIAMKVDGWEVMMVREVHMHPRGTASDYLCQPHSGVSYIMKKT